MAINYPILFERLGKLVKWTNQWTIYQSPTLLGASGAYYDIADEYLTRQDLITNMYNQFSSFAATVSGWESQLATYFNSTLADLQTTLNTSSSDPATILAALYIDMVANAQTIQSTVIAAPTFTIGPNNVGNGTLVLNTTNNGNVVDQRVINETVKLLCTADAFSGASSGGESFSVTGFPQQNAYSYFPLGNGTGQALTVANGNNILTNGGFETYTNNTFNGWTTVAGTTGTNITQNTSNPHRGSGCLSFNGDGSTTTIEIDQNFSAGVSIQTCYSVGCWIRKSGTVSSGSTFAIRVTGSNFSTVNLYSADPSTLTTSYQFFTAQIITPENTPIDSLVVDIKWTSANTAGASAVILIDDVVLVLPNTFGYMNYSLFAGSTDFLRQDYFLVTTAVTTAAIFQTFFSRYYSTYLPNSGSPTISDSLAM